MGAENTSRRLAILRVSGPLLVQALHLPPDTVVDDVRMSFGQPDAIELRVDQADLPLAAPGAAIPLVNAEFRSDLVEGPAWLTSFVRWVL